MKLGEGWQLDDCHSCRRLTLCYVQDSSLVRSPLILRQTRAPDESTTLPRKSERLAVAQPEANASVRDESQDPFPELVATGPGAHVFGLMHHFDQPPRSQTGRTPFSLVPRVARPITLTEVEVDSTISTAL